MYMSSVVLFMQHIILNVALFVLHVYVSAYFSKQLRMRKKHCQPHPYIDANAAVWIVSILRPTSGVRPSPHRVQC